MIHPHTRLVWISEAVGHGVVATRPIPRGTITWVRDPFDQLFDEERVAAVPEGWRSLFEMYSYVVADGQRLLTWDLCRYMNHACDANVFSPGLDLEVAVRDIEVGDQLTSDYASLNLEQGFGCLCGSGQCRGWVCDEQFACLTPDWDAKLRVAFASVSDVQQPLWELIADKPKVERCALAPAELPSISCTRHVPHAVPIASSSVTPLRAV